MPKLNTLQLEDRINDYNRRMKNGEEVAIRDIKAILSWVDTSLIEWMDIEWDEQQKLRQKKRARTEEEKAALGYKTKRDIQVEALKKAVDIVSERLLNDLENELKAKELRQAKTLLTGYETARANGKSHHTAFAFANNELTRAKLPRVDGVKVDGISDRDRELWAIEDELMEKFYNEATDEEREQYDMLNDAKGVIPRWRETKMKRTNNEAKKKTKK